MATASSLNNERTSGGIHTAKPFALGTERSVSTSSDSGCKLREQISW
jgi:hypothetical protein